MKGRDGSALAESDWPAFEKTLLDGALQNEGNREFLRHIFDTYKGDAIQLLGVRPNEPGGMYLSVAVLVKGGGLLELSVGVDGKGAGWFVCDYY